MWKYNANINEARFCQAPDTDPLIIKDISYSQAAEIARYLDNAASKFRERARNEIADRLYDLSEEFGK